jgi:16S rRNA processing protein RimM
MSTDQPYFSIGKFSAVFGLDGQLVLQHALGKKTALKGLEVLFIEDRKDSFLPYFIEKAALKNEQEVFVKLEGIDTREAAQKLTRRQVWLQEADFRKHAAAQSAVSLLGYMMIDESKPVGEIAEVIEQPHQLLCTVMIDGKEALIPLHEASLLKIDKKNKKVFVQLPEGLLDIYR